MKETKKWLLVVIYAVAMAWVESAVVYYLRTMIDRIDPHQAYPLNIAGGIGGVELIREAATLAMLAAVGWLAGSNRRARIAYATLAFGAWDIFYYVFLKVICGWPHSLSDWDLLFLLPLPWWGPVWAPVGIATLMILGGTLASQFDREDGPLWPGRRAWAVSAVGAFLALYVFMADSIRAVPQGARAVRDVLPMHFNGPLFLLALALMAAPVLELFRQFRQRKIITPPDLGQAAIG
jgi:hypothetical protein